MNLKIINLIFHSFDFWFKTYNVIILLISRAVIADHFATADQKHAIITEDIAHIAGVFFVFLMDATPVSNKVKFFVIILICCYFVFLLSLWFVAIDENELNWNPFQTIFPNLSQYTNVNWKSIMISAYANLALFVGKPLGPMVYQKFKHLNFRAIVVGKRDKLYPKVLNDIDSKHVKMMQSTSLYKKQYFEWNLDLPHTQLVK